MPDTRRPGPDRHNCINQRLPTYGGLYASEFEKDGRELKVRVEGQVVVNAATLAVDMAVAGIGLVCVLEDHVLGHVEGGRLVRVRDEWCSPFSGYHPYYPSRRQHTPAFALLVDLLRYRG